MTDSDNAKDNRMDPPISFSDFMENVPPGQLRNITDLGLRKMINGRVVVAMRAPEIQLHCSSDSCNGTRFFRCVSGADRTLGVTTDYWYMNYRCSNCQITEKMFSLGASLHVQNGTDGVLYKIGEVPTFGPPTPSKLMKLIGPDRDDFLKGRRCENQGLGVGAFIYYRRVVESQKNRILGEIIKVLERLGAPEEKINALHAAIDETQFSRALDMAKDVLPESLLIEGHSPIKLLHSALSDGVHAQSDEACMDLATSVRIVLAELSDRIAQALKDEAELSKAVASLLKPGRS